ncbi:MAG: hypothetical protein ACREKL_10730 [Chthoniobacterales bacterium]
MKNRDKNFAEVFCEWRGIPRERFVEELLPHALYPHATLLLMHACGGPENDLLKADRAILADVGAANDIGEIAAVLSRLPWYYGWRWSFRRWSRLRVSSQRTFRIARRTGVPGALRAGAAR